MLRRLLIILGYLTAAVVILGGTVLLVAYLQGYSYDFSSGSLTRRGLVLINSTPGSATVTRDHSGLKKRTNYRATYDPGTYTFHVAKSNYHTWDKTLTVVAGEVTDARYIVLVPNKPDRSVTASLATAPSLSTTSRDRRHVAYLDGQTLSTVDLPGGQPQQRYTFADPVTALSWSDDASHLLATTQGDGGTAYWVLEDDGSNPVNLTSTYGFDFSGLVFSRTDWRVLYWTGSDGNLRRLDLGSKAVSGVLASNVSQVSFAGDRVLYVQTTDLGRSVFALPVNGSSEADQVIQALPQSDNYQLVYMKYDGEDNLIVIPSQTREATLYTGIFGSSPLSSVIARGVDQASFSPDGHLAVLWSSTNLISYNLDRSTPTKIVTTTSPNFGDAAIQTLAWFDSNHLVLDLGGRTVFTDFDGTNRIDLGAANTSLAPFASGDQRSVFGYEPTTSGGVRLIRSVIR